MWTRFESSVRIDGTPRPMTAKDFASFGKVAGVPLPAGWRDFMARYGPGELAGYFNLRGVAKRRGVTMTLAELVALYRDNLDMYVDQFGRKHKARLARLVPFGDTVGGDILAWDPGRAQPAAEPVEYPVLMLRDGADAIDELAPAFEPFRVDVCLSASFGDIVGDPGWTVERTFKPV
jgi:hypothetical protein